MVANVHCCNSRPAVLITSADGGPANAVLSTWFRRAKPAKWMWRSLAAVVLGGQCATRILRGGARLAPTVPFKQSFVPQLAPRVRS